MAIYVSDASTRLPGTAAVAQNFSRVGSARREWFGHRNAVLIFAKFRTWKSVRVHSARRAAGHARKGHRRGMRSNKFTDDFPPGIDYFRFVQALAQTQALHHFLDEFGRGLPPIASRFSFGKTAPFCDDGGSKRRVHLQGEL